MLGRQQIAGIPTAISEIFKNSYDAYATKVRGDVFFDRRILVIRDDGVGMTAGDFVSRWLTVGTDSKSNGSSLPPVEKPAEMAFRKQMGEKGIGRLAIASTGPQLLIASRALSTYKDPADAIVFALIQWSMFEIPGLTLDDVVVPIREVNDVDEIDSVLLHSMATEIRVALGALGTKVSDDFRTRIQSELDQLDFEPRDFLQMNGPNLADGPGTAFIVSPVSADVDSVMEPADNDDDFAVSEFQRFLLGFTNSVNPSPDTPKFSTEFIRHSPKGIEDVIDPGTYFWEAEDFELTDHLIEGDFDNNGFFRGRLSIYGAEAVDVNEPWRNSKGRPTACGAFKIKFGYVQGQASESRLPASDFTQMTRRLEKIGGLYVYRDGIRVLPYGNSDKDYLEIEKRRSLNAATYYFSYRRMFGAIDLTSEQNQLLQEKAGREGFRENQAYRDFISVLQSFLIQLAANHFSSKAATAEDWRAERQRIKERSPGIRERERRERTARQRLLGTVEDRLAFLERGQLTERLQTIEKEIDSAVRNSEVESFTDVQRLEGHVRQQIEELRDFLLVERPAELPVSKDEDRTLASYGLLHAGAEDQLRAFSANVNDRLQNLASNSRDGDTSDRVRAQRLERVGNLAAELQAEMQDTVERVSSSLSSFADAIVTELSEHERSMLSELTSLSEGAENLSFSDEAELGVGLRSIFLRHRGALENLSLTLTEVRERGELMREVLGLKEQVIDLREQMDANVELLQLGQAVQVVSHEFEASIRSVRQGLQALAPWARSTPRLRPIVRDLRASFTHLDGYLRLFTPLQRRLYRESILLTGSEIRSFLNGVFGERLSREGVDLEFTPSFMGWQIYGFPSTFYPVFVNLVDNAMYWVTSEPNSKPKITLDVDDQGALVSDNGPGIRDRDKELVFDRGFGRRPGGRGLGLSLARDLLARDGWNLSLDSAVVGTTFRISSLGDNDAD